METTEEDSKIEEWSISIEQWRESARGVLTDDWDLQSEVELHADQLVSQVYRGVMTIRQLRAGVIWANALDSEATERQGSDLAQGDFVFERTARRIMHHAGRTALEQVKNQQKRTALTATYGKSSTIRTKAR